MFSAALFNISNICKLCNKEFADISNQRNIVRSIVYKIADHDLMQFYKCYVACAAAGLKYELFYDIINFVLVKRIYFYFRCRAVLVFYKIF